MAHATPIPRSYGIDDTKTIPHSAQTKQAATRAAYIARVVGEAPPLTDAQLHFIAVTLRPVIHGAAA